MARTKGGRFKKRSSTRRRRKPKTNVTNIAVSYLVANAVSNGMFGVGLPTFLGFAENFAGGYNEKNHSNEVTLKELFDVGQGGTGGIFAKSFPGGMPQVLMSNFKNNWLMMGAQVIGIPIAARVITKAIRKPILTPANRMLKQVGITDVKV